MAKATRAGLVFAPGLFVLMTASAANGASEVAVGGFHDSALRAAQRTLMQDSHAADAGVSVGGLRISVDVEGTSAMTSFTPRFGGLGFGRPGADVDLDGAAVPGTGLDASEMETERRGVRIGPQAGTEIGGFEVNWSAIAEVGENEAGWATGHSDFLVGGEFALSGLRVDAAVGREPDLLGLEGRRMTAGVAYDFGPVDARLGYSRVEDQTARETGVLTFGSQLTPRPGLILQGDLAYSEGDTGDPAAAGLLSLHLAF